MSKDKAKKVARNERTKDQALEKLSEAYSALQAERDLLRSRLEEALGYIRKLTQG